MKRNTILIIACCAILSGSAIVYTWQKTRHLEPRVPGRTVVLPPLPSPEHMDSLEEGAFHISEPYTYKNLTVYLIRSKEGIPGKRYVSLEHALKNKMVLLKETEDVNELSISNKSDAYVFINSGDIVRGGKQDRTMQYDVIVGPGDRHVKLASFCVESGRWESRGEEDVTHFSTSKNSLASKEQKVAAKMKRDQSAVWAEVGTYQAKATENVNHSYSQSLSASGQQGSISL